MSLKFWEYKHCLELKNVLCRLFWATGLYFNEKLTDLGKESKDELK